MAICFGLSLDHLQGNVFLWTYREKTGLGVGFSVTRSGKKMNGK
jgi:hypothetical protein